MYGLNAPETKRQRPSRLKIFLDYLSLEHGTLEGKAKQFIVNQDKAPNGLRITDEIYCFSASKGLYEKRYLKLPSPTITR